MIRDKTEPATGARAVADQVEGFRRSREARRAALTEDYVELIAELIESQGEARTVDIANRLGVAQPTVVKALARLKREGLIVAQPYRAIFLTDAGRELAGRSRRRHQIVVEFLKALGVSPETAERDAEGVEHHVSEETLAAFAEFCRPANGFKRRSRP